MIYRRSPELNHLSVEDRLPLEPLGRGKAGGILFLVPSVCDGFLVQLFKLLKGSRALRRLVPNVNPVNVNFTVALDHLDDVLSRVRSFRARSTVSAKVVKKGLGILAGWIMSV